MEIIETGIAGLIEIVPTVYCDERGSFYELYNEQRYREAGIVNKFCQENCSFSVYGVIRGLHFQAPPFSQAKLATCADGIILDVAVDLRIDSATYGQWRSVILDSKRHNQFLIPKGFAHGFSVLSQTACFSYRCDSFYHPKAEGGILYSDADLGIDWSIPKDKQILSEKDLKFPRFKDFSSLFRMSD